MSVSNLHNIFVIKNEESGMPSDMSILSVCWVAAAAMAHCCPGLGWAAGPRLIKSPWTRKRSSTSTSTSNSTSTSSRKHEDEVMS